MIERVAVMVASYDRESKLLDEVAERMITEIDLLYRLAKKQTYGTSPLS